MATNTLKGDGSNGWHFRQNSFFSFLPHMCGRKEKKEFCRKCQPLEPSPLRVLVAIYVWQEGEKGVLSKVPAIIAVPYESVSSHIGLPPILTYASGVLYNWALRDSAKPMTGKNMYTMVNYTGTEDESWFFVLHVQIELTAAPAIRAIREFFSARAKGIF